MAGSEFRRPAVGARLKRHCENTHRGGRRAMTLDALGRLAEIAVILAKALLFVLVVVLVVRNSTAISRSINRLQTIAVPGVVELSLQPVRPVPNGREVGPTEWATSYRVSELEVVAAKLDDDKRGGASSRHAEWVEMRAATSFVDLAGGYIGDTNELREIPATAGVLGVGECIRIITFGWAPVREEDHCGRAVRVRGAGADGFLKADIGEGDRIVVFDRSGSLVLDMDYWITE